MAGGPGLITPGRFPAPVPCCPVVALLPSTPGLASVETLDRGLVAGSAEGRIWSRVVDQIGKTQGLSEVWHIGAPPMGATLHLSIDAPLPDRMRIWLPWMTADGGIVELSPMERTPSGVTLTTGPITRPDLNPDPVVILYP